MKINLFKIKHGLEERNPSTLTNEYDGVKLNDS